MTAVLRPTVIVKLIHCLDLECFDSDLLHVMHAKAKVGCVLDVSRFPNQDVHVRIVVATLLRAQRVARAIPNRDGTFCLSLGFNNVQQQPVNGYWVCSEKHLLGIKAKTWIGDERTAVPHSA